MGASRRCRKTFNTRKNIVTDLVIKNPDLNALISATTIGIKGSSVKKKHGNEIPPRVPSTSSNALSKPNDGNI